jgi:hypothetical protein
MRSFIQCAAALVLAGALSGVCFAQDQGPDPGQPSQAQSDQGQPGQDQPGRGGRPGGHHGGVVRAACQADIAKLCGADADSQRPFRCLRDHQDSVSDGCKSAMATARAERQARGGGPQGGWSHGGGPDSDSGSPNDMGPSNDAQPQH